MHKEAIRGIMREYIIFRYLRKISFVLLCVCLVGGQAVSQSQTARLTRSAELDLALKRYAAAGMRAYVVGSMDGNFPPMGWHIPGEMGGVWAHPIKLLDGYWFALNGTWLPAAQRFTSGPGYVEMQIPSNSRY